jgi:hypothetical protein
MWRSVWFPIFGLGWPTWAQHWCVWLLLDCCFLLPNSLKWCTYPSPIVTCNKYRSPIRHSFTPFSFTSHSATRLPLAPSVTEGRASSSSPPAAMSDHQPTANDEVHRGLARCHGGSRCECLSDAEMELRTSITPYLDHSVGYPLRQQRWWPLCRLRRQPWHLQRRHIGGTKSTRWHPIFLRVLCFGPKTPPFWWCERYEPNVARFDLISPFLRSRLMLDLTISWSIWPKFLHLFHGFGFLLCSALVPCSFISEIYQCHGHSYGLMNYYCHKCRMPLSGASSCMGLTIHGRSDCRTAWRRYW